MCLGAMSAWTLPSMPLADSQRHGAGCELFLVEGESAAGAVAAVRDAPTQAVLPLQGKPLNAWRAGAARVAAYPLYRRLAAALCGADATDGAHLPLASLRFERLMLLFDPDADVWRSGDIGLDGVQDVYMDPWPVDGIMVSGRVWHAPAWPAVLPSRGGLARFA